MSRLVLLDNEAVQVLGDPAHRKHRIVISHVLDAATRTTRARPVRVAVPTVVRVEAGYDRRSPASAFINRFRVEDIPLDTAHADAAAGIVKRMGVSVADAHLGAAIQAAAADHVKVLTCDPGDIRKAAEGRRVDVVPL